MIIGFWDIEQHKRRRKGTTMTTEKMEPFKNQCLTCATTHTENGKILPGTLHCKDPKYAHLMGARCWNYTAKEMR